MICTSISILNNQKLFFLYYIQSLQILFFFLSKSNTKILTTLFTRVKTDTQISFKLDEFGTARRTSHHAKFRWFVPRLCSVSVKNNRRSRAINRVGNASNVIQRLHNARPFRLRPVILPPSRLVAVLSFYRDVRKTAVTSLDPLSR